jgi:hypothetical protein
MNSLANIGSLRLAMVIVLVFLFVRLRRLVVLSFVQLLAPRILAVPIFLFLILLDLGLHDLLRMRVGVAQVAAAAGLVVASASVAVAERFVVAARAAV